MTVPTFPAGWYVWATTDNQAQAAGITQRLIDGGRDATYCEVAELSGTAHDCRSALRYAVVADSYDRYSVNDVAGRPA